MDYLLIKKTDSEQIKLMKTSFYISLMIAGLIIYRTVKGK